MMPYESTNDGSESIMQDHAHEGSLTCRSLFMRDYVRVAAVALSSTSLSLNFWEAHNRVPRAQSSNRMIYRPRA